MREEADIFDRIGALANPDSWDGVQVECDRSQDNPLTSGAVFSACGTYRYVLWRIWDAQLPLIAFGMLNPSTADHLALDPTITRCKMRAQRGGAGGLLIWNLFAYRATDPKDLKAARRPICPENNQAILRVCSLSDHIIAGWGGHGSHQGRDEEVREMLCKQNIALSALAFTKAGLPRHPLYLPYDLTPKTWDYAR